MISEGRVRTKPTRTQLLAGLRLAQASMYWPKNMRKMSRRSRKGTRRPSAEHHPKEMRAMGQRCDGGMEVPPPRSIIEETTAHPVALRQDTVEKTFEVLVVPLEAA